jgi:hypothetical protein
MENGQIVLRWYSSSIAFMGGLDEADGRGTVAQESILRFGLGRTKIRKCLDQP